MLCLVQKIAKAVFNSREAVFNFEEAAKAVVNLEEAASNLKKTVKTDNVPLHLGIENVTFLN